ncbi:MAG TPA: Ppx/GppA phosphatase family protein [Candidatus Binataceae bacterium]|nr:Ppx/GppA phosphatase family protein [Candidatus Binataceae bacterium]
MKLGALDVGTNTVLMLVVEADQNQRVHRLADFSRITRMGRGVDKNGRLDPDSARRTLEAIVEFTNQARALGAEKIVTAATSALRDASDGPEFIAQVKARAGLDLDIISGDAEAELSYLAVRHGLPINPSEKLLIVDIGGGSTELIQAEPGHDLVLISLQIGSVRLTERNIKHDPPADSDVAQLRATIDREIDALNWNYRPDRLVGIAGTVTTVCAVSLGMTQYDSAIVHGHRLSLAEVTRVTNLFRTLPLAERKRLPGLLEGRADVIFAGAAILERAMARFGVDAVTVSDQGVRWGLVWRELKRAP